MVRLSKKSSPRDEGDSGPSKSKNPDRPHKKQRRFTSEETTARILDAAEYLFSRRDPHSVTVREIAQRAGVTHALVHQYIGTKEEVLSAVTARAAPDRTRMVLEDSDFHSVMPLLFNDVQERRIHTRSVIRSAMDGVEYTSLKDRLTTGRAMLDLAIASRDSGVRRLEPPDAMDPRVAIAAAVAFAYGWVAVDTWLVQIFDLEDEDPAELRARLAEVFTYIADLVLPSGDEPGSQAK